SGEMGSPHPAHRGPDNGKFFDVDRVHQCEHLRRNIGKALCPAGHDARSTVTPHLGNNESKPFLQCLDLRLPHAPVPQITVTEQHRGAIAAVDHRKSASGYVEKSALNYIIVIHY